MLCGVGGRTIAEAQQRLSYPEFLSWAKYRARRGSLHLGLRVDHGAALLATLYANAHSKDGGYTVADFARYHDQPEEKELTLEEAMRAWC